MASSDEEIEENDDETIQDRGSNKASSWTIRAKTRKVEEAIRAKTRKVEEAIRAKTRKVEGAFKRFFADTKRLLFRSFLLSYLVLVAHMILPILPFWMVMLLLLSLTVVALLAPMYCVAIKRHHKASMYTEGGIVGRINGRWSGWTFAFLFYFLISTLVLLLRVPGWNVDCVVIVAFSPLVFSFVYFVTGLFVAKQVSVEYRKGFTMRSSIVIASLLLALISTLSSIFLTQDAALNVDLAQFVGERELAFSHSPSALMRELDLLISFSDSLEANFIEVLSGKFAVFGIAVGLLFNFIAFSSVACLFGVCLLNRSDLKRAFSSLPEESGQAGEIQARYFVVILVAVSFAVGALTVTNFYIDNAVDADGHTPMERIVGESTQTIALIIDSNSDEKTDSIAQEMRGLLTRALGEEMHANFETHFDWGSRGT